MAQFEFVADFIIVLHSRSGDLQFMVVGPLAEAGDVVDVQAVVAAEHEFTADHFEVAAGLGDMAMVRRAGDRPSFAGRRPDVSIQQLPVLLFAADDKRVAGNRMHRDIFHGQVTVVGQADAGHVVDVMPHPEKLPDRHVPGHLTGTGQTQQVRLQPPVIRLLEPAVDAVFDPHRHRCRIDLFDVADFDFFNRKFFIIDEAQID